MGIQVFFMFPETRQKYLEEIGIVGLPFILMIDVLFDENIPAWKTRSGPSRMDEKAARLQRDNIGKRNSDTTVQQDEKAEKLIEPENIEKSNGRRMDRNVGTV
jgi:hypothetical protein